MTRPTPAPATPVPLTSAPPIPVPLTSAPATPVPLTSAPPTLASPAPPGLARQLRSAAAAAGVPPLPEVASVPSPGVPGLPGRPAGALRLRSGASPTGSLVPGVVARPAIAADPPIAVRPWIDDPFSAAIRSGTGPLWLRREDGGRHRLDVERWCAPPDAADRTLLDRCLALGRPTLDVGCGPGRLVTELLALGLPALGVDLTSAAVDRTRGLGGSALCRSVFDRLPGEGRWGAILLADGNLGIGGDPGALLRRLAGLLAPDGTAFVEVEPDVALDERLTVRIEDATGRLGPPFRWARLGLAATSRHAADAGLTTSDHWTTRGRQFTALRRGRTSGLTGEYHRSLGP